jgi:predicted RNA-binding Zn-ribbon protein involved in translation (DUF1610 family)
MATSKELTLVDCPCGGKPTIAEITCVMSKDKMYVYKCPTCGLKGEMYWPKDGELAIKSWNHTIKTMVEHVKYKSLTISI